MPMLTGLGSMILYNTTYSIPDELAAEWLRWMKTFQLPAVMGTELPAAFKILHLLTELDNGGVTYSVQLTFESLDNYNTYQIRHTEAMQQRIRHRFGNQLVSFDTLLEEV